MPDDNTQVDIDFDGGSSANGATPPAPESGGNDGETGPNTAQNTGRLKIGDSEPNAVTFWGALKDWVPKIIPGQSSSDANKTSSSPLEIAVRCGVAVGVFFLFKDFCVQAAEFIPHLTTYQEIEDAVKVTPTMLAGNFLGVSITGLVLVWLLKK